MGPGSGLEVAQHRLTDHLPMTLLDRHIGQLDLEDLTDGVAVRHSIETERGDQQVHVQRVESVTEHALQGPAAQNAPSASRMVLFIALIASECFTYSAL